MKNAFRLQPEGKNLSSVLTKIIIEKYSTLSGKNQAKSRAEAHFLHLI